MYHFARSLFISVLLFCPLISLPVPAAASTNMTELAVMLDHGSAVDVAAEGTTGCVATDKGFIVYDITDPVNPVEQARVTSTGWPIEGIALAGGIAYLSTYTEGVHIYDVSTPAAPVFLASYPCTALRAVHSGIFLYVCAEYQGLIILDVSDPAAPTLVSRYLDSGRVLDVDVSWMTAYVGTSKMYGDAPRGDLVLLDVSYSPPHVLGHYWQLTSASSITLGLHAYCADNRSGTLGSSPLDIVNASNPASPVRVGGTYLETSDCRGLSYRNGYVYAFTRKGVRTVDVYPPASAAVVSSLDLGTDCNRGIATGDKIYQATGASGVKVLEATNPAAPVLSGYWDTPSSVADVIFNGNRAYLCAEQFWTLDISNPAAPQILSCLNFAGDRAEIAGNLIYAAGGPGRVAVIDISDPDHPAMLNQDTGIAVSDMRTDGGWLYSIELTSTLKVYDLSDPVHPALHGSVALPARPKYLSVSNGYAYISGETGNFYIVDVTNPDAPQLRTTLTGVYRDVEARNGRLYVSRGTGGLEIYDLSVPDAPALVGSLPGNPTGLEVHGSRLYMANNLSGVEVIDVTNPAAPVVIADHDVPAQSTDIAVAGNIAIAGLSSGFAVYQIDEAVAAVDPEPRPRALSLSAFPNPFEQTTRLHVSSRSSPSAGGGLARLSIFDAAGRHIRSWDLTSHAGDVEFAWNGSDSRGRAVPVGIYFARVTSGGATATIRIVRVNR